MEIQESNGGLSCQTNRNDDGIELVSVVEGVHQDEPELEYEPDGEEDLVTRCSG